ncbi:RabGAP/TBC [Xylona heveae TC161]|uniref:RabGAP/TBC n=1 Tax=Xylona heveae (strain CBS 132557 / TC161) TaxID=1328760 RepID=A0A165JYG4_XYLHT|nr:RabGAP/TBC [Xylona heveae TC161]KZF26786.1 RabGAP/TBC [Xylona heveae TC161]
MSVVQVPSSPPELSRSKSSKSSSFRSSSQFSVTDGYFGELSHFEEIGLDDDSLSPSQDLHSDVIAPLERFTTTKRASFGKSMATATRTITPVHGPLKEITSAGPRGPAATNGVVRTNTFGGPVNGGSRTPRGLVSASTPSLMSSATLRNRSPSPAPSGANGYFAPTSSDNRTLRPSSSQRSSSPGPTPSARRGSWQMNRKTIEELEEEYHDSDEDVPDDAVFWNVPISPRPLQERSISAAVSPGTSPPKDDSALSQNGTAPTSPAKPPLPRAATMGSIPEPMPFSRPRIKSWTAALSDLSEEAKTLTVKLEARAEEEEREHEQQIQNGAVAPQPRFLDTRSKSSAAIELPPLRKGDVMIDPLPISREKEKVLSRTRPSWLPPKSAKEERKHLREYQHMMAMALEAEKKRAAKEQEYQNHRDAMKTSLLRIWDQHVLPNWETAVREPRTRELWWRGIAPRNRGVVWQKAVGNELELTDNSYSAALKRAKELEKLFHTGKDTEGKVSREEEWFEAIRRDARDTFPELQIFQPQGPLHESLVDVLMAYAVYRPDLGYIYGTHRIAGVLLLNLSPSESFRTLANLLNRPLPLAFLTRDESAVHRAYDITLRALQYKLPRLYDHLCNHLMLHPDAFIEPLFTTLFTRCVPLDIVTRIWDVYVFEGDKFLVRTAVALLAKLESKLYGNRGEVLKEIGWSSTTTWDLGREDDFMMSVRSAGKEEVKRASS